jgi:hypothetical protein
MACEIFEAIAAGRLDDIADKPVSKHVRSVDTTANANRPFDARMRQRIQRKRKIEQAKRNPQM